MLCLSRKKNESIVIDDKLLVITVLEIDRGKVPLGFEADRSLQIDRAEVYVAKKAGFTPAELSAV